MIYRLYISQLVLCPSNSQTSKTLPARGVGRCLKTSNTLRPQTTISTVFPRIHHSATKLPESYLGSTTLQPSYRNPTSDPPLCNQATGTLPRIHHSATKLLEPYLGSTTLQPSYRTLPWIHHSATKLPEPYLVVANPHQGLGVVGAEEDKT